MAPASGKDLVGTSFLLQSDPHAFLSLGDKESCANNSSGFSAEHRNKIAKDKWEKFRDACHLSNGLQFLIEFDQVH